jgi:hypothetical protein
MQTICRVTAEDNGDSPKQDAFAISTGRGHRSAHPLLFSSCCTPSSIPRHSTSRSGVVS